MNKLCIWQVLLALWIEESSGLHWTCLWPILFPKNRPDLRTLPGRVVASYAHLCLVLIKISSENKHPPKYVSPNSMRIFIATLAMLGNFSFTWGRDQKNNPLSWIPCFATASSIKSHYSSSKAAGSLKKPSNWAFHCDVIDDFVVTMIPLREFMFLHA